MNKTTKINILAYASEPDKNTKYEGEYINYQGKRYFVSLAEERGIRRVGKGRMKKIECVNSPDKRSILWKEDV